MARQLAPGDVIGGFRLEQKFHHGGLGTLWKVSRPDIAAPLVMKLPFLLPGEDPLTIVSYETEQMILPRLSGSHVPAFIAAGDFAVGMKDFFAEGGQKHGEPILQFPTCSCRWLSPETNEKKNEYWVRHCKNLDKTKQEMQVHAK